MVTRNCLTCSQDIGLAAEAVGTRNRHCGLPHHLSTQYRETDPLSVVPRRGLQRTWGIVNSGSYQLRVDNIILVFLSGKI